MNERIRELAIEAGAGEWGDSVVPAMMNIEKFAELIVQECAGVVADAVDHREPASTYVDKIKKHFGVEE